MRRRRRRKKKKIDVVQIISVFLHYVGVPFQPILVSRHANYTKTIPISYFSSYSG
jgi:hypothetical protein